MALKNKQHIKAKEKGATLVTTLVFLTLMAIVSVSATKLSTNDLLLAGNNQQKIQIYQQTANDLSNHVGSGRLINLIQSNGITTAWDESMLVNAAHPNRSEKIASRAKEYQCIGNGLATSIGGLDTPVCYLFDFQVENAQASSSVKEKHARGAGKEFPQGN